MNRRAALLALPPLLAPAALGALGLALLGWPGAVLALLPAGALAVGWGRTVGRLESHLHRLAEGETPPAPLPPLLPLEGALARLDRARARQAEALDRQRAGGEAIVAALPDPLLVLDAAGQPVHANPAATRLLGDGLSALLRHPRLADATDRALRGGGPQEAELALPGMRECSARLLPLDPPLPDGGRLLLVLADRSAARAAERMRVDFVTNASHELRTPLASIMGFIETLRGPAADDTGAQRRFLAIMAEQGERMRRLIEDLLGLSRVEATEHLPPTGAVPLDAVLRAEAAALEPLFAARGIALTLEVPAALTAAPADAEQLAQVARNLLDNALRHAQSGVALRAFAEGERVGFAVEDDGPGIAREHIPRLTERFYRVDKARGRASGNTGLGLAIVKHIVGRHRGALLIESEPGNGARFRVSLPGYPGTPAGS